MHIFLQLGPRAQAGVGANGGTPRDVAPFEMRKRTDGGAGFDRHIGSKDHVLLDHRVAPDIGVIGKKHRLGGQQRDPVRDCGGACCGLKCCLCRDQFRATVHAQRFGLFAAHHSGRQPLGTRDPDDVGEVIFAHCIIIAHGCD